MTVWTQPYFLHRLPVGLSPVLDGLLLLLGGSQLLLEPLQLLQKRRHLAGFVLGVLLRPAQPAQLAAHALALRRVGTLQAHQPLADRAVLFVLRVRDTVGGERGSETTSRKPGGRLTCSSIFLCSCMILFSMPLLSFLKCSTERASIFSFFSSRLALILRMQHCR